MTVTTAVTILENVTIAVTQKGGLMKNDKERREYATDPLNWSVVGEYGARSDTHPGAVRISKLTYGGECWYKVEIMKEISIYNYVKSRTEWKRGYYLLGMYSPSADGEVFGEHVSVSQIATAIKEIDMGRR